MTLGEKIRDARMQNGLSQEELAVKLSVSRSAIAKWKRIKESEKRSSYERKVSKCQNIHTIR